MITHELFAQFISQVCVGGGFIGQDEKTLGSREGAKPAKENWKKRLANILTESFSYHLSALFDGRTSCSYGSIALSSAVDSELSLSFCESFSSLTDACSRLLTE